MQKAINKIRELPKTGDLPRQHLVLKRLRDRVPVDVQARQLVLLIQLFRLVLPDDICTPSTKLAFFPLLLLSPYIPCTRLPAKFDDGPKVVR